jgi:putative hydrolase of the HAD superfamily
MFHAALERSGAPAECIVHVGDNPEHDIQGAREVGMYTVWMNGRAQEWPGGPAPDREIDNLRQLPQAIDGISRGGDSS